MVYHSIPIRLAKSKMPKSKALMRMWNFIYYWWECKTIQLLGKAILLHLLCWILPGCRSRSISSFAQPFAPGGRLCINRLPVSLVSCWVQWKSGGREGSEFMVFISLLFSVFVVPYPLYHRSCHRTLSVELHFLDPSNCFLCLLLKA